MMEGGWGGGGGKRYVYSFIFVYGTRRPFLFLVYETTINKTKTYSIIALNHLKCCHGLKTKKEYVTDTRKVNVFSLFHSNVFSNSISSKYSCFFINTNKAQRQEMENADVIK